MTHARNVMETLESHRLSLVTRLNDGVRASWHRSVTEYDLDPERVHDPDVLTHAELLARRAPIEELMSLACPEVDRLGRRLAEHAQVIMLSDAEGVVVLYRCSETVLDQCTKLRVLPGSIWTERSQGTNGVGLCLREQRPVSVVAGEHFATKLSQLSCTVAPIFGAQGRLVGTLNISSLHAPDPVLQGIMRELVTNSARRIENLVFDARHRRARVLRLSRHNDFCDAAAEARIALDDVGRIIDATPLAQQLLVRDANAVGIPDVIGRRIGSVTGVRNVDCLLDEDGTTLNGALGTVYVRPAQGARRSPKVFVHAPQRPAHARLPAGTPTVRAADTGRDSPSLEDLVGDDPTMVERLRIAQRLHARRIPLLLQGESGSGKTQLARALHEDGPHRTGGFVVINCAAIPQELIESELFGYRPGAFTGAAKQGSPGRLIGANGGTLFLDEIGDMPLALQGRLLQVLSEGEFVPVGATEPVQVRFALLSASLRDMPTLVREGRFREDLFFRLSGASLTLPPLRARADLPRLIDRAFAHAAAEVGLPGCALTPQARKVLMAHSWPGNIRELQHVARFALAINDDEDIDVHCLPSPLGDAAGLGSGAKGLVSSRPKIDDDPAALSEVLESHGWNVMAAAAHLGISRATLHRRINEFQLRRPEGARRDAKAAGLD